MKSFILLLLGFIMGFYVAFELGRAVYNKKMAELRKGLQRIGII